VTWNQLSIVAGEVPGTLCANIGIPDGIDLQTGVQSTTYYTMAFNVEGDIDTDFLAVLL